MTKADLVDRVAEIAGIPRGEAEVVVKTVLDAIVEALRAGDKIELRGFGSFRLRKRRPRQGRNPRTGDRVPVPGKAVPYFKPGKHLRDRLNAVSPDGSGEPPPAPARVEPASPSPEGSLPEI